MGHGDHWKCLGQNVDVIKDFLPLVHKAEVKYKLQFEYNWFGAPKSYLESVMSVQYPETDLNMQAILVYNKKSQTNDLYTAYPFCKDCISNNITLENLNKLNWSLILEVCFCLSLLSDREFDKM